MKERCANCSAVWELIFPDGERLVEYKHDDICADCLKKAGIGYKLFIFEFERGDTSGGLAVVSAMSKEMAMKELKKEHDYDEWECIKTLGEIPKKTKVVAIDYLILCGDV